MHFVVSFWQNRTSYLTAFEKENIEVLITVVLMPILFFIIPLQITRFIKNVIEYSIFFMLNGTAFPLHLMTLFFYLFLFQFLLWMHQFGHMKSHFYMT
jgi:hypothetical protein